MIFVTHALPVNSPGEPLITRDALWDGLVRKAENALSILDRNAEGKVTSLRIHIDLAPLFAAMAQEAQPVP